MDPKLLEILACPACKGPLEYSQQPPRLACAPCRRVFEVSNGIPDLILR